MVNDISGLDCLCFLFFFFSVLNGLKLEVNLGGHGNWCHDIHEVLDSVLCISWYVVGLCFQLTDNFFFGFLVA